MKVGELREKLAKLKKEEITKLAVEFYKLIPKAKKEDYDVDALINNPTQPKKSAAKTVANLNETEVEITEFIAHASEQYYIIPNRVVSKKERPKWRFKVKRWYKELINTKRADKDVLKQSLLLKKLYDLLCESCDFEYFSSYDTFESISISQSDFFNSVVLLRQEASGKVDTLKELIRIIVKNPINRYTLRSELMPILIEKLDAPALKMTGIEHIKKLIDINQQLSPKGIMGKNYSTYSSSSAEFYRERNNNNLTEFGYHLYSSLHETDEGIAFFHKHHKEDTVRGAEIKLYILIRILFSEGKKEYIVREIERAVEKGIQAREGLLKLAAEIKKSGALPRSIPR